MRQGRRITSRNPNFGPRLLSRFESAIPLFVSCDCLERPQRLDFALLLCWLCLQILSLLRIKWCLTGSFLWRPRSIDQNLHCRGDLKSSFQLGRMKCSILCKKLNEKLPSSPWHTFHRIFCAISPPDRQLLERVTQRIKYEFENVYFSHLSKK